MHATRRGVPRATAASGASGGLAVHEAYGGGFEQKRQVGRHFSPQKPGKKCSRRDSQEPIVRGALARPAMQRRVASLARAHAASTQGSAPHGDQMLVDPSVTAGSASRDAQNFDHVDDERRQVFASTASMAVQSSVRTAIDAAAAETLADLDSGSVTALAPGASSPLARANADGSTRSSPA